MDRLSGKIALITGGSSGIGLETAKLFAKEGAFVFITGRRQAELEKAVAAIGSNAKGIRGDIANLGDLDGLFKEIKEVKGRLDILFANAGLGEFAPLGTITEAHFDKTFGVNVRGTLFTVQKALPLMGEGSVIVLNASIAAIKGIPAFSVYAASKAAIRSFARGWSVDLRDRKIRVNVVSPGTVPTPAYDGFGMTEDQMAGFLKGHSDVAPVGRVGLPSEIAEAVLFLASDKSSFVNGAELFVDGGFAQV
ncbi:SDR family oxidoreductase [Bradyrhizobium brasilense]|uniref:NAD(P)-dependent dehydrogenase, short-chain alcohol dehydrogenase family n=1 Tax=Bradyrhizobium brasilense TaxID=1419277 RepID=A0A1G7IKK5_9BRAD|nr:SDR family oxidoreductase [Bradyrhizobium brasilense]MCC8974768.1 SDR family oxidoreductase [Bradyrhizobium brasilense]SDF13231.1 NAD(P)-dependent dehydrogenase, short-chain alcohol dehydrogenase family [Bradyrhizobium brasilense]